MCVCAVCVESGRAFGGIQSVGLIRMRRMTRVAFQDGESRDAHCDRAPKLGTRAPG